MILGNIPESKIVVQIIDDPDEVAMQRAIAIQHRLNSDWLASHWDELLPQARGRWIAVADQQGMIADSADEAAKWAEDEHGSDRGALIQFVRTDVGPRIY